MKEKVIVGLGRDEAERILMWGRRWCIQPFWSRREKRSNQDWTVARSVSSWDVSLSLLILGDGVWGDGVSKVGVSEGVG